MRKTRMLGTAVAMAAVASLGWAGTASAAAVTPRTHAQPHNAAAAPADTAKVAPATSYNGGCGSGYSVIDSLPVSTLGTVYLTYSGATGDNCVVTVRATPGTAINMGAYIELAGDPGSRISDNGRYTTYAGPVYLSAPGRCIDWGGTIGTTTSAQNNSHCG